MRVRLHRLVSGLAVASVLLAACGSTKVQSQASHPVDTSSEPTSILARLPKSFPVRVVPLPKGASLINVANDSTKHRAQFQLTYAPSPSSQAAFMNRYVKALKGLGFVQKQDSYANTPSALYSLDDTHWEVLVEGSSSTVGVSVVALK
jgi:hypothetical protein